LADGTAGIAIPAAKAHGRYTADQVRSAYEKTSKLLAHPYSLATPSATDQFSCHPVTRT
jgi:hypothetical protein